MPLMNQYLDPARPTRRWISLGLVVGGMVAGALVGLGITVLGKIVAGAPPADFANYRYNAIFFGVVGAVIAPSVIWSTLRKVPLWRTIMEPLAGALLGAGIGTLLGSGVLFLLLTPIGAGAAVYRLEKQHRKQSPTLIER